MALAAAVGVQGGGTPLNVVKVLALTRYGPLGASSRVRFLQYLPWLEQEGMQVTVQPLLSDELLRTRYQRGTYGLWPLLWAYACRRRTLLRRHRFALMWVEKEAFPWLPAWLERWLLRGVPYVLDYDDAVFHNYDLHRSTLVRRFLGRRLDKLMASARLVVAGNSYLAQRARDAGAPWVEVLPTVIDLDRYAIKAANAQAHGVPCIVWIGSPSTTRYLALLREPLRILSEQLTFKLRVIGGGTVDMPGVTVESVAWSEATEVASILAGDIGVMPLDDSSWERGKCGYKLIQYMACGLPVVASAVGVNPDIVRVGENGYLARDTDEWVQALGLLLRDRPLRAKLGQAGRLRVEEAYCVQVVAPKLSAMLRMATQRT